MQGSGEYNALYEERTPEALKDVFMSQKLPAEKNPEKARKIDQYVTKGIYTLALRQVLTPDADRFAIPVLIYGTTEKAKVGVGFDPSGMDDLVASIPVVAVKRDFTPLALTADQDAIALLPLPSGYQYVNKNKENAPYYVMPDQKTPRLGSILPNAEWDVPCVGVTESGYIAMQVTQNGGCFYCYDPVEVKRILGKK